MYKQQLMEQVSGKLKLIRTEYGYSQEKMAEVIGLSKKTLVQIEKERQVLNWSAAVAVCVLFRESDILQSITSDDPIEVIETIAHERIQKKATKTMGGKVWWKEVRQLHKYTLQQNLLSQHYRVLDGEGYRWFSSFNLAEAEAYLERAANNEKDY